jgi:hypothetical protein
MSKEPYSLLSSDEMTILKKHYHATKEGRLGKEWTPDRKKYVAKLLKRIFDNGFFLQGVYPSGSLMFGRSKPSATQLIMELSDNDFRDYQKGNIRLVNGQFERVNNAVQS